MRDVAGHRVGLAIQLVGTAGHTLRPVEPALRCAHGVLPGDGDPGSRARIAAAAARIAAAPSAIVHARQSTIAPGSAVTMIWSAATAAATSASQAISSRSLQS